VYVISETMASNFERKTRSFLMPQYAEITRVEREIVHLDIVADRTLQHSSI